MYSTQAGYRTLF